MNAGSAAGSPPPQQPLEPLRYRLRKKPAARPDNTSKARPRTQAVRETGYIR